MAELLDERHTVELWVHVEAELALAQAKVGLIDERIATEIERQVGDIQLDLPKLWEESSIVGYPILPLLNQLVGGMTEEAAGRLHFGATTQDILDTALAVQLAEAGTLLLARIDAFGDSLADRVRSDRGQLIAARTHAQQATPTTLGVKWAVFLAEFARHRRRLRAATSDVACVSLFGAGGTSAATGEKSSAVRRELADRLGLRYTAIPWHVSRDSLAMMSLTCASVSASLVRLAREIVDLSRTEVAEVSEARDAKRGASSTMPQKANPILSEAIIGFGVIATSSAPAVLRSMEAGHERAAGEWQVEWGTIPHVLVNTSSALLLARELLAQLVTYPERMTRNMSEDGGSLMSEALMMSLATSIGRDRAHEIVYEAVRQSRVDGEAFADHVGTLLSSEFPGEHLEPTLSDPILYLGEAAAICDEALVEWSARGD
jgi:3-carboxy-cis,cis-muconate cycloisomerase